MVYRHSNSLKTEKRTENYWFTFGYFSCQTWNISFICRYGGYGWLDLIFKQLTYLGDKYVFQPEIKRILSIKTGNGNLLTLYTLTSTRQLGPYSLAWPHLFQIWYYTFLHNGRIYPSIYPEYIFHLKKKVTYGFFYDAIKLPKSDFWSQFSTSKINEIQKKAIPKYWLRHGLLMKKSVIKETIFCQRHFFWLQIFEPLYFLKWRPIFDLV